MLAPRHFQAGLRAARCLAPRVASRRGQSITRGFGTSQANLGSQSLADRDPELASLVTAERSRQVRGLELIASENFTSEAVMDCLGSCLTNKYSEGLPGRRYYGGNQIIDQVELLCQTRALKAFGLDPAEWGVNVQPYSGSVANVAAFTALLQPHERFMGLSLTSGGHLSHGFYKGHEALNVSSRFWTSLPYELDAATGLVDYDALEQLAARFVPRLLVAGGSAYPRDWDYARMRAIADQTDAFLLTDMSHFSGLVAGKQAKSPFEHSDVVMTTTHKSLRGPRSAMLFYRKTTKHGVDLEAAVNGAVFPGCQGGPHNHQIAAVATQLLEVQQPEWAAYTERVVQNAKQLGASLEELGGYKMVSGGTDTHLLLWDLRPAGLTGSKFETVCDQVEITVNKNTLLGDKSALSPGGVRLGTPALTTRGMGPDEFKKVAEFLHKTVLLATDVQERAGSKALKAFKVALDKHEGVAALRHEVEEFSSGFYMPGH